MSTIQQARREVQRSVRRALALAQRADGPAVDVEALLWKELLATGRAMMALFFAVRAHRPRAVQYVHEGRCYELVGREDAVVGTLFGRVSYQRSVGRQVNARTAARDLPLDRELGLPAGFTQPVVALVSQLCAMMAFGQARRLFESILGWAPSPRAVLRMVDATGGQAKPFLDQAELPEDDGEVLVIEVDSKGAPAISSGEYARRIGRRGPRGTNRRHQRRARRRARPRQRRAPGKKSKNAKMAAVGAIYTLKREADGKLEGPLNKRVYATFESHRALFEWLRTEAQRRGYGTATFNKVLFLADGSEIIWDLKAEFFPDADAALDWFHIVEKLWDAGKAICRHTRRQREALESLVGRFKRLLRSGKVSAVIDELRAALEATPATGPGNKYRRDVLARVLHHFVANEARMQYQRLRFEDLPISTGIIEGTVRHLVGMRLDGPGMRWSRDRAEAVLHLRCIMINGQWRAFESFLARQTRFRLAGQPVPTRTHDAKLKAA
jgi:hypothetical protein